MTMSFSTNKPDGGTAPTFNSPKAENDLAISPPPLLQDPTRLVPAHRFVDFPSFPTAPSKDTANARGNRMKMAPRFSSIASMREPRMGLESIRLQLSFDGQGPQAQAAEAGAPYPEAAPFISAAAVEPDGSLADEELDSEVAFINANNLHIHGLEDGRGGVSCSDAPSAALPPVALPFRFSGHYASLSRPSSAGFGSPPPQIPDLLNFPEDRVRFIPSPRFSPFNGE